MTTSDLYIRQCELERGVFALIQFGLNEKNCSIEELCFNDKMLEFTLRQGISSICFDGFKNLFRQSNGNIYIADKNVKLRWIAFVMKQEQTYQAQWNAAKSLAELYYENNIDTYVLKGFSLSRLYPNPKHRHCTDMDCYLMNGYEYGNKVANKNGLDVDCSYYKHSKIYLKGLIVENHQFLLPVKGSGKAKKFERELRSWIDDGQNDYINDSKLKATSPFFDAVYVLAHAQEHFLNEGIVLRHICDWAMVLKTHADKVNWNEWKRVCSKYGMLSFGYAMSRLAHSICGIAIPFDCPTDDEADRWLLDDTLYRHTVANTKRSKMQIRIGLVKNMFNNSRKYRMFSDTNFLMSCGRRVWGYLFDKDLD